MASRKRKTFGCLLVLLILLVGILVLIQVLGPSVATRIANNKLPEQIGAPATLGGVRFNLLGGSAAIHDLEILQPEGFEGGPLLKLDRFEVKVPLGSAMSRDPLVVEKFHLSGLDFRMITDTNQVSNVSLLGPPAAEEAPEPEVPAEPAAPPPVWIRHMLLEGISVAMKDLGTELELDLTDIELELEDIRIQSGDSPHGPGRIRAQVSYEGPRASGQLLVVGRIGTLDPAASDRMPPLQLAVGLIGFDLDLIAPLLKPSPAAAKSAIAGSGFDLEIFLQITPGETLSDQQLQGNYLLSTDRGGKMKDKLGGTLKDPDFPPARILGNLVGFQFARLGRFGVNVAEGGLEAGRTVLNTGGAAVKGVGNTALKLGGGLLKTVKGVATLDMEEAGSGLKDATVGTVTEAARTVGDTAGTAVKGVGDTAGKVAGSDDSDGWWGTVEARKQDFLARAETFLEENPFPPQPVERKKPAREPKDEDEDEEKGWESD